MPISSFEKAPRLFWSYKTQLAVLLFPLRLKFLRTPYRKKDKIWYSSLSSGLLTKFKLSVSLIWLAGLIEKLAIMKLPCDFRKVYRYSKLGSYILDFVLDEEPKLGKFEVELFSLDMFCAAYQ